jgi:signal transduction histidine kinase
VGRTLHTVELPAEAKGDPVYITESRTGEIWLSIWANGVFKQDNEGWRKVHVSSDPWRPAPDQVFHDRHDNVWMIFRGELSRLENGKLRPFTSADGLTIGRVQTLALGPNGLIAAGDLGIARFDGSRFQSLLSAQFPDFSGASGIVLTTHGDVWINTINGVVLARVADLEHAFDEPGASLPRRLFGMADGMPGIAQQDNNTPSAVEAADGTVWFLTNHGVVWIDPKSFLQNHLPPPVKIRSISAGGRSYAARAGLTLPPGSDEIGIDYTALSLSAPERVRFRYRLKGVDTDWVDPGERRQAFYTNLGPGPYTFELIAANNDGVWNKDGVKLDFRINPMFVQTWWFYTICGLAVVAALWRIYLLRLRHLSSKMDEQMEARLTERDRIARELHDTLLQGFQGLLLNFQAIAAGIPKASPLRHSLEDALDRADKVLVEGRERIIDLRTADRAMDLSHSIGTVLQQLGAGIEIEVRLVKEGKSRAVTPLASTEICEIVQEALWNAYRHANCKSFEVRIIYHRKELHLIIRDDGIGIDRDILEHGGKPGHYGLTGMRERACVLRGRFEIESKEGGGCTIILYVPGRIAYRKYDVFRLQVPLPITVVRWFTS